MTRAHSIWIDLDNSPHVPFFRPIIGALQALGHPVVLTARDAYNVSALLELHRLPAAKIGRHFGRHRAMKAAGLAIRAAQLVPFATRHRPALAVSHGSRAQTLAAKLLGIPSVVIADYEHVTHVTRPDWIIVPDIIPIDAARKYSDRVLKYPGIKEDVYVPAFSADPSIMGELGLSDDAIVVTVRPPATEAHYHCPQSDELSEAALRFVISDERTRVVLLPRNDHQKAEIERCFAGQLARGKMIIPPRAVDGLNLVWHSDLVISGGGTMNREAAALGIPVYSTFRGPTGAVDRYLAAQGRLVLLESASEVPSRVAMKKRNREARPPSAATSLDAIVQYLTAIVIDPLPSLSSAFIGSHQ
jgi:uncharacterized protein